MTSCNNFKKYKTLSLLSVCLSSIRVFLGPITLLVLAKNLSTEELGFYYAFFSLTAMAQLLEVGMSSVLKQYYSHSYAILRIGRQNVRRHHESAAQTHDGHRLLRYADLCRPP